MSDDQRPQFHVALRRIRVARDMSIREMGERAGVKPKIYESWESGEDIPTPPQFSRLRKTTEQGLGAYRKDLEALWRKQAEHVNPSYRETVTLVVDEASQDDAPLPHEALVDLPGPAAAGTFGEALRRARVLSGLSQADLATLVGEGVSGSTVGRWESDEHTPILAHWHALVELVPALAEVGVPRPKDMDKPGRRPGDVTLPDMPTVGGPGPADLVLMRVMTREELIDQAGVAYARACAAHSHLRREHAEILRVAEALGAKVARLKAEADQAAVNLTAAIDGAP